MSSHTCANTGSTVVKYTVTGNTDDVEPTVKLNKVDEKGTEQVYHYSAGSAFVALNHFMLQHADSTWRKGAGRRRDFMVPGNLSWWTLDCKCCPDAACEKLKFLEFCQIRLEVYNGSGLMSHAALKDEAEELEKLLFTYHGLRVRDSKGALNKLEEAIKSLRNGRTLDKATKDSANAVEFLRSLPMNDMGEFVLEKGNTVIMGLNGSGKSTLLRSLNNLVYFSMSEFSLPLPYGLGRRKSFEEALDDYMRGDCSLANLLQMARENTVWNDVTIMFKEVFPNKTLIWRDDDRGLLVRLAGSSSDITVPYYSEDTVLDRTLTSRPFFSTGEAHVLAAFCTTALCVQKSSQFRGGDVKGLVLDEPSNHIEMARWHLVIQAIYQLYCLKHKFQIGFAVITHDINFAHSLMNGTLYRENPFRGMYLKETRTAGSLRDGMTYELVQFDFRARGMVDTNVMFNILKAMHGDSQPVLVEGTIELAEDDVTDEELYQFLFNTILPEEVPASNPPPKTMQVVPVTGCEEVRKLCSDGFGQVLGSMFVHKPCFGIVDSDFVLSPSDRQRMMPDFLPSEKEIGKRSTTLKKNDKKVKEERNGLKNELQSIGKKAKEVEKEINEWYKELRPRKYDGEYYEEQLTTIQGKMSDLELRMENAEKTSENIADEEKKNNEEREKLEELRKEVKEVNKKKESNVFALEGIHSKEAVFLCEPIVLGMLKHYCIPEDSFDDACKLLFDACKDSYESTFTEEFFFDKVVGSSLSVQSTTKHKLYTCAMDETKTLNVKDLTVREKRQVREFRAIWDEVDKYKKETAKDWPEFQKRLRWMHKDLVEKCILQWLEELGRKFFNGDWGNCETMAWRGKSGSVDDKLYRRDSMTLLHTNESTRSSFLQFCKDTLLPKWFNGNFCKDPIPPDPVVITVKFPARENTSHRSDIANLTHPYIPTPTLHLSDPKIDEIIDALMRQDEYYLFALLWDAKGTDTLALIFELFCRRVRSSLEKRHRDTLSKLLFGGRLKALVDVMELVMIHPKMRCGDRFKALFDRMDELVKELTMMILAACIRPSDPKTIPNTTNFVVRGIGGIAASTDILPCAVLHAVSLYKKEEVNIFCEESIKDYLASSTYVMRTDDEYHRRFFNLREHSETILKSSMITQKLGLGLKELAALSRWLTGFSDVVINFKFNLKDGQRLGDGQKEYENFNFTRLMHFSNIGDRGEVRACLDNGDDPNLQDTDGLTALMYASQGGFHEIVQDLLAKGAERGLKDQYGHNALIYASKFGHELVQRILLEIDDAEAKKKYVNEVDQSGRTALMLACVEDQLGAAKLLLENGANDTPDEDGTTALIRTALNGKSRTLELLLGSDHVDLDAKDKKRFTVLTAAAWSGSVEAVEAVLRRVEKLQPEAVGVAAEKGYTKVVELLIQSMHLPASTAQSFIETYLLDIVVSGHGECVDLIIGWLKTAINEEIVKVLCLCANRLGVLLPLLKWFKSPPSWACQAIVGVYCWSEEESCSIFEKALQDISEPANDLQTQLQQVYNWFGGKHKKEDGIREGRVCNGDTVLHVLARRKVNAIECWYTMRQHKWFTEDMLKVKQKAAPEDTVSKVLQDTFRGRCACGVKTAEHCSICKTVYFCAKCYPVAKGHKKICKKLPADAQDDDIVGHFLYLSKISNEA